MWYHTYFIIKSPFYSARLCAISSFDNHLREHSHNNVLIREEILVYEHLGPRRVLARSLRIHNRFQQTVPLLALGQIRKRRFWTFQGQRECFDGQTARTSWLKTQTETDCWQIRRCVVDLFVDFRPVGKSFPVNVGLQNLQKRAPRVCFTRLSGAVRSKQLRSRRERAHVLSAHIQEFPQYA